MLASLLIDPDAMQLVVPILRAADFYHPQHRDTYAAMLSLFERGAPTDFVQVCDELERLGKLDDVGGVTALSRWLTVVPTPVHVEYYAHIVARTAFNRRLIGVAGRTAGIGYQDLPIDEAAAQAEEMLFGVTEQRQTRGLEPLGELVSAYLEGLSNVTDAPTSGHPCPTGFIDVDRILGGLQPGNLVTCGARPSVGKTALALCIARHAAVLFNRRVALFSVEMSSREIANRMLCLEGGFDSTRLRGGKVNQSEMDALVSAIGVLSQAPIWVDDTASIPLGDLRARARRLHHEHPLSLVIVDYLGLVKGKNTDNRVQEISEISRSLKALAGDLGVTVLALAQLNRAVEGRVGGEPRLSDLRDSGTIEQDSDVVLFLHRNEDPEADQESRNVVRLLVAKHRNGPTGVVSLNWEARSARFRDLARG